MKLLIFLRPIISIFFVLSITLANNQQTITILGANNTPLGKADIIKKNQYYISLNDIGEIVGNGSFVNNKTEKIVIYVQGLKIKLSNNISFIVIDDKTYQMKSKLFKNNDQYYAPIDDFFNILLLHGADQYSVDYNKMSISLHSTTKKTPEPVGMNVDLKKEKINGNLTPLLLILGMAEKIPVQLAIEEPKKKTLLLMLQSV